MLYGYIVNGYNKLPGILKNVENILLVFLGIKPRFQIKKK